MSTMIERPWDPGLEEGLADPSDFDQPIMCTGCGAKIHADEAIPVLCEDGEWPYCEDCICE